MLLRLFGFLPRTTPISGAQLVALGGSTVEIFQAKVLPRTEAEAGSDSMETTLLPGQHNGGGATGRGTGVTDVDSDRVQALKVVSADRFWNAQQTCIWVEDQDAVCPGVPLTSDF